MQGTKQDQEIINLKTGQLNNIIEKNNHSQENNRSAVPTKKSINLSLISNNYYSDNIIVGDYYNRNSFLYQKSSKLI